MPLTPGALQHKAHELQQFPPGSLSVAMVHGNAGGWVGAGAGEGGWEAGVGTARAWQDASSHETSGDRGAAAVAYASGPGTGTREEAYQRWPAGAARDVGAVSSAGLQAPAPAIRPPVSCLLLPVGSSRVFCLSALKSMVCVRAFVCVCPGARGGAGAGALLDEILAVQGSRNYTCVDSRGGDALYAQGARGEQAGGGGRPDGSEVLWAGLVVCALTHSICSDLQEQHGIRLDPSLMRQASS